MINFEFSDFLNGNAIEFAKLIGNTYKSGGIGQFPSYQFLTEQYHEDLDWGVNPLGRVFQPGTYLSMTAVEDADLDRGFVGNAYLSITFTQVPASYSIYVMTKGMGLGSSGDDGGTRNTNMKLWQSTNLVNSVYVGQTILIELPKVPFIYTLLGADSASAEFEAEVSTSYMGLLINK